MKSSDKVTTEVRHITRWRTILFTEINFKWIFVIQHSKENFSSCRILWEMQWEVRVGALWEYLRNGIASSLDNLV